MQFRIKQSSWSIQHAAEGEITPSLSHIFKDIVLIKKTANVLLYNLTIFKVEF